MTTLVCAFALSAQPKVGAIEIYGARKIPADRIRKAAGVAAGDPLPRSKGDIEERVEAINGVLRARAEAVCCDQSRAILYIGIEERGAPVPLFREEPGQELQLATEILEAYEAFASALARAARADDALEDLTQGHSFMTNPEARAAQERLLGLARESEARLRQVLKESAYPDHRAIAAYVLQYAPGKRFVLDDLQLALQDPDEAVRRNAMRALKAIGVLGRSDAELGIRVRPTWFVELLNSLVLSDRVEAARSLVTLTEPMDEHTLANLKERALPSLFEAARWQHLSHALPAFLLLGRVAGWTEARIQSAWSEGERAKYLDEWARLLRPR